MNNPNGNVTSNENGSALSIAPRIRPFRDPLSVAARCYMVYRTFLSAICCMALGQCLLCTIEIGMENRQALVLTPTSVLCTLSAYLVFLLRRAAAALHYVEFLCPALLAPLQQNGCCLELLALLAVRICCSRKSGKFAVARPENAVHTPDCFGELLIWCVRCGSCISH